MRPVCLDVTLKLHYKIRAAERASVVDFAGAFVA